MKKIFAAATMTLAMCASSMFGGTISYTATLPDSTVPFTDNFTLTEFNTALGMLNSIVVTLNYTDGATVTVFNASTTNYAFTNGTAMSTLVLSGPVGLLSSVTASAGPVSGTALASQQTSFPGAVGTGSATANPVDLTDYEGPGSLALNFSVADSAASFTGTSTAPANTLFFGGSSDASGNVTITYNYTATSSSPEPATMTLFGSALLGIGFFARKRLKK